MPNHHRPIRRARGAFLPLALLALLWAPPAAAQAFHAANVQVLHGTAFHDALTGNDTRDGRLSTITLESVAGWTYGDNFFFVDLASGDFADGPEGRHRMYAEWESRLSISKLTGRALAAGIVGDLLVSAGVERGGTGFGAVLLGLATDLRIPGLAMAQVGVYRRDDTFNRPAWQATGAWGAPVRTGPLAWTLAGFVDVAGTDAGTDVMTQPQLLLDLGALVRRPGRVHGGIEWYLHRGPANTSSVAQALFKLSL